jgi:lipoprotein signal peptidase
MHTLLIPPVISKFEYREPRPRASHIGHLTGAHATKTGNPPEHLRRNQVVIMIVFGIILIALGLLLPSLVPTFAFAHICLVIGVILLVVGLLMMLMGRMGHAVGGRRHYY